MVLLIFIIDEVVTKFQTKVPKPFLDFFVPEKKKNTIWPLNKFLNECVYGGSNFFCLIIHDTPLLSV